MEHLVSIEVVCSCKERQVLITLEVPSDSSVEQAILQSRILNHFPEIDVLNNPVGIFGRVVTLSHPVSPGDRIELYRPLKMDPKQARRLRARKRK